MGVRLGRCEAAAAASRSLNYSAAMIWGRSSSASAATSSSSARNSGSASTSAAGPCCASSSGRSMVNALVIRRNTQLAKGQKALRAAQYVRMSTELQRYSIQNQAAAIAAYAQQRNLTIVRTYVDEGRSGVRINGRAGLIELIEDVQAGKAASITSWSTTSVDGDASRTSTRVRITSLSVSETASRLPTALNSSTTMEACCPASSRTSSV